jgi:ArsR family transcriptional regulator, arsenate/arsenite/antimonite-responsive transcriptional repressor
MNAQRAGPVKKKRCMTEADQAAEPVPNSQAADEKLAKLAWAVAHPARVRILRILLARQACICGELVDQMTLAQSTVSQHLKILKEAGIVQGEIDGPKVCYCIDSEVLQRLKDLIAAL